MKYYLVDYEYTKKEGLIGISSLSKDDVICVFCKKEIDIASVRLNYFFCSDKCENY